MDKNSFLFFWVAVLIFGTFLPGRTMDAALAELPDLVVREFWIWPKSPTSREWFDIRVRVYNFGKTMPLNQTTIHVYVGGSTTPHSFTLDPLQPNQCVTKEKRIFLAIAGKYLARAIVDPGNKIKENREDNNTNQFEFMVKNADSQEFLPDLSIYPPHFEPKEPCIDDPIHFRIAVQNKGAVAAPASKAAITVGGGAPVLLDVPQILPGESKSSTVTILLSMARNYMVTAYADYGNNIKEYDEENNSSKTNFEVFDQCCGDLVIRPHCVWIWPKNPRAGQTFDVRVRIFNYGKKATQKSTIMNLFVGGSPTPYVFNVLPIGPKSERTFTQKISLSLPGKYVIRAAVDPGNTVQECREDNNAGQVEFTVK